MKNTSLITILLYAVLGVVIFGAGYKACQIRKEKALAEQQDKAEMENAMRDMGLLRDSTAGSAYTAGSDSAGRKTTISRDGIEDDGPAAGTKNQPTAKTPQTPPAATDKKSAPATTANTGQSAPKKTQTTKSGTAAVKGAGTGKYVVRAGTFRHREGALERLEEVIKAGYPGAELSKVKTDDGTMYAVVVRRTNNKSEANKLRDILEDKGIDAAVF